MNINIAYAAIIAGLTFLIFMRTVWFRMEINDLPATYKLFAARDALIRLVVEGKISRDNPYFQAMYNNVVRILCSCRLISGPNGWPLAEHSGKYFARQPGAGGTLDRMPVGPLPEELHDVADQIIHALQHLQGNHFGIFLQQNTKQREAKRIMKEQAKEFLRQLPPDQCPQH